jgi:hypothetical protein
MDPRRLDGGEATAPIAPMARGDPHVERDRRMHLAWFLGNGFGVHDWKSQWRGTAATDWMNGEFHVDFIHALERACFDYLIIEDSAYVPDG